ncbi:DUF1186 domain-containing protein [Planctellipticum variicoloris]|uniref:DUF1186 domain-containing protein n=1 Tax=Planctellipticum variicoloris TaxID=3064265 RepID=UPI00301358E8|nr:DUF1186 domain-containing protein [Planctomycetaceae bacterium SH412]
MQAAAGSAEIDLDRIMQELDQRTKKLPVQALRTVQAHRDLFIPRLIQSLEDAATKIAAGQEVAADSSFFALFLLTEFQAKEAWPAIRKAISVPGDGAFDLFGDAVTESLSRVLAVFLAESPDELDELIADRNLNEYVRWQATHTYLKFVRDGRITRDAAVDRLRGHLRNALATQDTTLTTGMVCDLIDYAPREAREEIQTAFQQGLVDQGMVDLKTVERYIAEGDAHFQRSLERCDPTGIEDTVNELGHWAGFQEPPPRRNVPAPHVRDDVDDRDRAFSPTTIVNDEPRVGRNDPCPCGSGKKYKKCCGAA